MREHVENKPANSAPLWEILDSDQLAERLHVPPTWIRDQVRNRAADPIPHLKLGPYVRFRWASPELESWLARRRCGGEKQFQM